MSAVFVKEDALWLGNSLRQGAFSEVEHALLETTFDQQTDYDISAIEKRLAKEAFIRKICLMKMAMFPLEIILVFFLFGKKRAIEKKELAVIYKNFYTKKITMETLQTKILQMSDDGALI